MPWIKREPIASGSGRKHRERELPANETVSVGDRNVNLEKEALDGSRYSPSIALSENENMVSPKKKAPPGHLLITYRAVFFILAGSCFVFIWAFILGIVVGRDTLSQTPTLKPLEEILVSELNKKPPPEVEVIEKTNGGEEKTGETNPDLTFYNVLNQPRPTPERGLPAVPQPLSPSLPKIKPRVVETQTTTANAPDNEPEKNPTPAGGVKTVDPDASKAPAPARKPDENFTVQVAAAATVQEAEKEIRKLKRIGFDAYYYEVELNGRKYFRVRVGRCKTRDEARVILDKLAGAGRKNLFISILTD